MDIQIVTLCDAANDTQGAINILGARELFAAPQVPFTIPQIVLAVRIELVREDAGQHEMIISILDPEGNPVIKPADIKFGLEFPTDEDIDHVSNNIILPINGLKFEKPGRHIIDVRCDGEILVRRALTVLVRPEMTQGKPQAGREGGDMSQ